MSNIEIKLLNDIIRPVLINETGTKKIILEDFLFDARTGVNDYLQEIEKVENKVESPTGFTSNQIDTNFFPDKATFEHLWCEDENNDLLYLEMPLSEVKQILIEWKKIIEEWEAIR